MGNTFGLPKEGSGLLKPGGGGNTLEAVELSDPLFEVAELAPPAPPARGREGNVNDPPAELITNDAVEFGQIWDEGKESSRSEVGLWNGPSCGLAELSRRGRSVMSCPESRAQANLRERAEGGLWYRGNGIVDWVNRMILGWWARGDWLD